MKLADLVEAMWMAIAQGGEGGQARKVSRMVGPPMAQTNHPNAQVTTFRVR